MVGVLLPFLFLQKEKECDKQQSPGVLRGNVEILTQRNNPYCDYCFQNESFNDI